MDRRRKLTPNDLWKKDFSWWNFGRTQREDGVRGWWYELAYTTDEQMEFIHSEKWKNVTFGRRVPMYAPEQNHPIVFVWDKCVK